MAAPTDRPDPIRDRRTRPTISDVAAAAGVSISTVSHTLSGNRPISAATRARVHEAIDALGYGANPAARSLRTGRSGMVGLILRPRDAVHGSLRGTETFTRLSGAIATAVLDRGIGLVHVPDILDPAAARVPMDGCIVAHPYGHDEVLAELLRRGVPVVTVEEDPDHPDFPWAVTLDYETVVVELLDGLYGQGARSIALITGTEDNTWNRRTAEIYAGWAAEHGMPSRLSSLYEGAGIEGAETVHPADADRGRSAGRHPHGPEHVRRGHRPRGGRTGAVGSGRPDAGRDDRQRVQPGEQATDHRRRPRPRGAGAACGRSHARSAGRGLPT